MKFKSLFVMLALLAVSAAGVAGASSADNIYGDYSNSSVLYTRETSAIEVTPSEANFCFVVTYDVNMTDVLIDTAGLAGGENSLVTLDGVMDSSGVITLVALNVPDSASFVVKVTPKIGGDSINLSFANPTDLASLSLSTVHVGKSGGGTGAASVVSVSGTAPVPSETPTVTDEPVVEPTETSVPVDGNDSSDAGSSDGGSSTEKTVPGLGLMGILGGLGVTAFMARRRKA